MRNFRKYEVWRNSIVFVKEIYIITKLYPKQEIFGMISQIQRASVSISSNIAEGCSRNSEKDFCRFIEISLGSAFEVENLLILSKEIGYLKIETFDELIIKLNIIQKQLNSLISTLRNK